MQPRGVMEKYFVSEHGHDNQKSRENFKGLSTVVINASNANCGRANRLVSGAVVIEVERHSANVGVNHGEGETAESTLQIRQVDQKDDFIDAVIVGDGTALYWMENLEQYVTRPGVRRRKGVPQSVRQQRLQQLRTDSENE